MTTCKTLGCEYETERSTDDFCDTCLHGKIALAEVERPQDEPSETQPENASPSTIRAAGKSRRADRPDVYSVHHRFEIVDPSGALHQASRILLLCSLPENLSRQYEQIKQARDLLNRWLEINLLSTE